VDWYAVDPLWIHALRHGARAAVFHWVGSEGTRDGLTPEFRPWDKATPDAAKVAQILAWLRGSDPPRLIMSYLHGCDHVGHHQGPDHPDTDRCVEATDALLGELVAGLATLPTPPTLILTSDHGMEISQGEVNPAAALRAAGVAARVEFSGPVANVYLEDPASQAAAEAVVAGLPHVRLQRPDERHPTRTGDLVLRAREGWHFNGRLAAYAAPPGHRPLPGIHGGDPLRPDLGAILYLWGPGVRPGAHLPQARAHDVAPTAAHLLGLPPLPAAEGAPLTALLDPRCAQATR
jgi:predicted AlkP superfamily pyrophosphatase or phosphodiesterase